MRILDRFICRSVAVKPPEPPRHLDVALTRIGQVVINLRCFGNASRRLAQSGPPDNAKAVILESRMARRCFINYRREDTEPAALRLKADLEQLLPNVSIYLDQANNEGGENFRSRINTEIAGCDVVISLVGPGWLTIADASGTPRLRCDGDLVCEEIDAALDQDKKILPVLVDNVRMPGRSELPDAIKRFARLQSLQLSQATRAVDTQRIANRIVDLIRQQSPLRSWRDRALSALVYPVAAVAFLLSGFLLAVNAANPSLIKAGCMVGACLQVQTDADTVALIKGLTRERDEARRERDAATRHAEATRRQLEAAGIKPSAASGTPAPPLVGGHSPRSWSCWATRGYWWGCG